MRVEISGLFREFPFSIKHRDRTGLIISLYSQSLKRSDSGILNHQRPQYFISYESRNFLVGMGLAMGLDVSQAVAWTQAWTRE